IGDLLPWEYVKGWKLLDTKIRRYRPAVVALVGVTVYRAILPLLDRATPTDIRRSVIGPQPQTIHGARVFVLPNPSGRNANFTYAESHRWPQRVHETLVEQEGIQIPYSTWTRLWREMGLTKQQPSRCDRVPDTPGAEMQHDTSPYWIRLGDTPTKLIASLLYLRYSKRRYLEFFRVFNRFRMKCFLHKALMFWRYAGAVCIIDNTNLARLRAT